MGKILSSRLFWGFILVFAGILLLLDTFGIIKGGSIFWLALTAVAGVLFIVLYITQHEHWWALIPGTILITIAVVIGLVAFLPGFNILSTIILGGIGLSFLLVYLADRANWWAIIPAGVLATIAVVVAPLVADSTLAAGGIFLLGLALTFLLVAVLPNTVGSMRWAWIPAAILGVIGALVLVSAGKLLNYFWPIVLILGGLLLVIRAFRR